MEQQEKLIKAVNAELEEWLLSGDVDYLHKAMAVIRAAIEKEFNIINMIPKKKQKKLWMSLLKKSTQRKPLRLRRNSK